MHRGYFSRHSRAAETGILDKNAKNHHDALWRAWYNGLQTITIPAFSVTTISQPLLQMSTPIVESSPTTSSSSHEMPPSSSVCSNEPIAETGDWQPQLIGEVVHHAEHDIASASSFEAIDNTFNSSSPVMTSTEAPVDAIVSVVPADLNDDSFDSLTLTLTMATAPKQGVYESQL